MNAFTSALIVWSLLVADCAASVNTLIANIAATPAAIRIGPFTRASFLLRYASPDPHVILCLSGGNVRPIEWTCGLRQQRGSHAKTPAPVFPGPGLPS